MPPCWAVHVSHHSKRFRVSHIWSILSLTVCVMLSHRLSSMRLHLEDWQQCYRFYSLIFIFHSLISLWIFCRIRGTFCFGDIWWWGWRTIFSTRSLWHIFVFHGIFWDYRQDLVVDCRPCCTFRVPCTVGRQLSIQFSFLGYQSRIVTIRFWWVQALFCVCFFNCFDRTLTRLSPLG